jgi:hypothetical protein
VPVLGGICPLKSQNQMIKTLGAVQELVLRAFIQREFHESFVIECKQPVFSIAVELTTKRGFPLGTIA